MNARNYLYIRRFNNAEAKHNADDKLETKKILLEHNIATTKLLATFIDREAIRNFNWDSLPSEGFVIKPARGYGGGGILAMRKWEGEWGESVVDEIWDLKQIESHLMDILDGAYSLQYLPDVAFLEERLTPHPFFKKYGALGIPDIRVIVFHKVPVMAMMRMPTVDSDGKANLHLGALGVGLDVSTGITTYALSKNKMITLFPGTKIKTRGIKIPFWDDILLLAAKTQDASGLGYAGVDIVIDQKKGPLVLEVNARPGLSIQNANLTSLRTRLERLEDMHPTTPEKGVELAKSLFTAPFSAKVPASTQVLPVIQRVVVKTKDQNITLQAKLDSGAYRSSIDESLAKKLKLSPTGKRVFVQSASGRRFRPTVHLTFELAGKKITTEASIIDRSHLRYPMIVGRRDLEGFLIKPVVDEDAQLNEETFELAS